MILSASGWRKVWAESGDQQDKSPQIGTTNTVLAGLIAESFAQFVIQKTGKKYPTICVAQDTRPTGKAIADSILKVFAFYKVKTVYIGISAAPEIMAFSRGFDAFLYISASHNPIGHNGIKFGLSAGGVLEGSEEKELRASFESKCQTVNAEEHINEILSQAKEKQIKKIYDSQHQNKEKALKSYTSLIRTVITGSEKKKIQEAVLEEIKSGSQKKKLIVVSDMNGSSRSTSIDSKFIQEMGMEFFSYNAVPGQIVHEIIPEGENLNLLATKVTEIAAQKPGYMILGYMPDCDGDRGNTVYWDEKEKKAKIIPSQEVFALSVLAENIFEEWKKDNLNTPDSNLAVCVNGPTSMRISELCSKLGVEVFTAEVGESNVVHLGDEKRSQGYTVRILGEGSNGGNITYPSCVRDPLATLFALVKLLTIQDRLSKKGIIEPGLFRRWGIRSEQVNMVIPDYTLRDIIRTLPVWVTTGVSESRAILQVKTQDKGKLKLRFKKIFESQWTKNSGELKEKYGIVSYRAFITNGTKEVANPSDWNNGNGGLKVKFYDDKERPIAFIWMRPSGTESVFRVMCDVKGDRPNMEKSLLAWETAMVKAADSD